MIWMNCTNRRWTAASARRSSGSCLRWRLRI
nr:MAG TPA: hypothetical protein [Caudoviricetes sp.]